MSTDLQKKFLRVLEEGEVRRLGAKGADRRGLPPRLRDEPGPRRSCSRPGRFREDLYYRIAGVVIELPPLRERREDIPPLVAHFLRRGRGGGTRRCASSRRRSSCSIAYEWPGNVRELRNEVQRLVALEVGRRDPPRAPRAPGSSPTGRPDSSGPPAGGAQGAGRGSRAARAARLAPAARLEQEPGRGGAGPLAARVCARSSSATGLDAEQPARASRAAPPTGKWLRYRVHAKAASDGGAPDPAGAPRPTRRAVLAAGRSTAAAGCAPGSRGVRGQWNTRCRWAARVPVG